VLDERQAELHPHERGACQHGHGECGPVPPEPRAHQGTPSTKASSMIAERSTSRLARSTNTSGTSSSCTLMPVWKRTRAVSAPTPDTASLGTSNTSDP